MEDGTNAAARHSTLKQDLSYRLYHVDKYQLAKRLIFRKREKEGGSSVSVVGGLAVPLTHQKPDAEGEKVRKVCVRQADELSNSFVTEHNRKNSLIRNDRPTALSRIYTKHPKRFSTQLSNCKSNSITRIETSCRQEQERSPEGEQNDIAALRKGLTSLFRRQVRSIDQLVQEKLRGRRKITVNEFFDLQNRPIREYEFGKRTRVGLIPQCLRFESRLVQRGERLLVNRLASKVFSQYRLEPRTIEF